MKNNIFPDSIITVIRDMRNVNFDIPKKMTFWGKLWLFIIFAILFGTNFYLIQVYRPYIYENEIYDYHFADSFPSLLAIPISYYFFLFYLSLRNKALDAKMSVLLILTIVLANFIYEFLHLFIRVFDYYDLVAILLGGVVTYLMAISGYFIKRASLKLFPFLNKKQNTI